LLSRVGGHLGYYSSWIGLLCREYASPLLKKAERVEVPEPKTKGENKDSTYLSPAAAGHRLSRVQTFCIQEDTRLQKSHRILH
jgi:hypothetical protein